VSTRALPKTVAEWESYLETLGEPSDFAKAMNDGTFKENLNAYVTAQNAERADMTEQIKAFTEAALVDMFRQQGGKFDAGQVKGLNSALLAGKKPIGRPQSAPGAALNGTFGDIGEFMNTIWHGHKTMSAEQAEKLRIVNGMSEKVPSSGGFLVPEEFRQQLLMLELEESIVMPRANVIPMSSATLTFPTVDATSNASSVYGGIVVYRTEEGEEFVESEAKFGKVKLDPTKQTALAYVTNELIKDGAGALTSFILAALPKAMAYSADVDFLTGDGASRPLGALASANPGLLVVAKETGQGADTIVWENVLRMYSRMLPSSIGRAVWIASPDTFVELATMALSVGTGGSAVWITDGHGAPQLTLLGRPVIMTEKTPGILGAQGDLSLVDFGFYLIGMREAASVDTSPHVKFTSDQTTIRVIARNDGRPWLTDAITPQNEGPTLSPFVTLAERA
jgi:HK97 family phage major capsid protein